MSRRNDVRPLAPVLYDRLCRIFGDVDISNPGVAVQVRAVRGWDGRLKVDVDKGGEYYVLFGQPGAVVDQLSVWIP